MYSRQQRADEGCSSISGLFGLFTSQMYESMLLDFCRSSWNCMMAKATAILRPMSVCHEMEQAERFVAPGSLKTARVFADGGSLE